MKHGLVICAFLLLPTAPSSAQEPPHMPDVMARDSARVWHFNTIGTGFERNLNTFNWVGHALIDTTAWGTFVKLNERYTSNTILLDAGSSSSPRLQSDQQNISLMLGRLLAESLTAEVLWTSLVYSDNKSIGLGQAAFHSVLGGVQYSPFDLVSLNPLIGYRWDKQAGVKDKGLSYTMAAQTHEIDLDGYQISGDAQFHEDRLNPRLLQRHFVRIGAQKYFSGFTRDSLEVGYNKSRREFYAVADGNIESRIENILSFSNLLDYELDRHFMTSLYVNVFSRSLDKDIRHYSPIPDVTTRFNTVIDEFRLETFVQAAFRSDNRSIDVILRLGHSERDEQHSVKPNPLATTFEFETQQKAEENKDNLARRTSLSGLVQLRLSPSDTLLLSGAISILRYDTPSKDNVDDRDEQLIALSVSSVHTVSPLLSLGLSLEGNMNHIVYLLGSGGPQSPFSPSANNYVNRVLRLSPRAVYRPLKEAVSLNIFEVLANYTVYDFEEQGAGIPSFSYRQFSWVDSSSIEFTRRIGLDFFSYLKLYERGQFKWSDFSERAENSFVDKTISSQLRFSPEEGIVFAVGMKYFSQSRDVFVDGGKTPESFIQSSGPTCFILWDIGTHSRLMFSGWYERRTFSGSQTQPGESSQTLPSLIMTITINL
jgi:hypothetical protein